MNEFLGDRKSPRFDEKRHITLENTVIGNQHSATLKNFSGGGLNCESEIPYKSGTRVIVRIKNWPHEPSGKCYIGEIRWCDKISSDASVFYDIGIQIKSVLSVLKN